MEHSWKILVPAFVLGTILTRYFLLKYRARQLERMLPIRTPEQLQEFWVEMRTAAMPGFWESLVFGMCIGLTLTLIRPNLPGWAAHASLGFLILWSLGIYIANTEAFRELDRKFRNATWSAFDYYQYVLAFKVPFFTPIFIPLLAIETYRQLELNHGKHYHMLLVVYILVVAYCVFMILFGLIAYLAMGYRTQAKSELNDVVRELCERARIRPLRLLVMPERGGRLPIAMCLGGNMIISKHLIDQLTPDEMRAVLAHEIAHKALRHVLYRVMQQFGLMLVAAVAIILTPPKLGDPLHNLLVRGLLPLFSICVVQVLFQRGHMRQELAADRLAANLIGDAELMRRALIRVHDLACLPHDFTKEMKIASHPSLTTRIEALSTNK